MDATPLRRARLAARKTLFDVADAIGLSEATVSRIERGERKATSEAAEAIARYLGNVSEMEILYPERFIGQSKRGGEAA